MGIDKEFSKKNVGLEAKLYSFDNNTLNSLPDNWKNLIRRQNDGSLVSRILLFHDLTLDQIHDIEKSESEILYINPMEEYKNLFSGYRKKTMMISMFSILAIFISLTLFKGMLASISILSPIVLALIGTIGIIGTYGISFTLFHTMGAILVLGIGLDYALFLYCRDKNHANKSPLDWLLLANVLCAFTTLMSFGFLSFSKTNAIHDFGLFVFIGIILCFLNTTLFLGEKK